MQTNEKRAFKRIDDSLQIKYEILNSDFIMPLTSYTKNVSKGGFLFRSNVPVNLSSVLKLKFYLNDFSEFICADAKVVRVEEVVENKIYDIGIKFININEEDIDKLTKYVSKKYNI